MNKPRRGAAKKDKAQDKQEGKTEQKRGKVRETASCRGKPRASEKASKRGLAVACLNNQNMIDRSDKTGEKSWGGLTGRGK